MVFFQHYLEDLLFFSKPLWRSIALEWLALCARVFLFYKSTALKWLAMCMIYCVLVFKQHWQQNFSRFVKSILTGKVKLIIHSFMFCSKILNNFNSVFCSWLELSSCVGLVVLGKFTPERCFQQHCFSAMVTASLDCTLPFI